MNSISPKLTIFTITIYPSLPQSYELLTTNLCAAPPTNIGVYMKRLGHNPSQISQKKVKSSTAPPSLDQRPVQLGQGLSSTQTTPNLKMLANRNKSKTVMGESQAKIDSILPSWLPGNPLNPDLFSIESKDALKAAYHNAKPYKHVQLPKLCTHEAMTKIQDEVIHYLPTSSRETDLFKVNQSIDLNNVDLSSDFAKKIPNLIALRTYLYSNEFRGLLQEVTGCNEIIDTVDCAANVYSGEHGNHLLTHDDVITTRVLSYIIYLPLIDSDEASENRENEENRGFNRDYDDCADAPINFNYNNTDLWSNKLGGSLELFDNVSTNILPFGVYPSAQDHIKEEKHAEEVALFEQYKSQHGESIPGFKLPPKAINIPISIPSKQVKPNFNTMVVFEVKSQSSYHAVQEVYSINSKRISIQGWFHQHIRQPDFGATLRMLQVPTVEPTIAYKKGDINTTTDTDADDDKDILQYVENNRLAELNQKELEQLTFAMFPSRQFELFKFINENVLAGDIDGSKDAELLQQEEVDYLSKIVLLHVRNIMLKQNYLLSTDDSKDKITNPDENISKTENTPKLSNSEEALPNEDTLDDIDIYEPELIKKDLLFLRKFMAPEYSSVGVLKQLQEQWNEQGFLQLGSFIKQDVIRTIIKALIKADVVDRIALIPDFSILEDLEFEQVEGECNGDLSENSMDFDFDAMIEEDIEENEDDAKTDAEDSMDFDFMNMVDEDDEETPPKPRSMKQTTESTENIPYEQEAVLIPVYLSKPKPPQYLTGLNKLSTKIPVLITLGCGSSLALLISKDTLIMNLF